MLEASLLILAEIVAEKVLLLRLGVFRHRFECILRCPG
jgi:hypothetical protein